VGHGGLRCRLGKLDWGERLRALGLRAGSARQGEQMVNTSCRVQRGEFLKM